MSFRLPPGLRYVLRDFGPKLLPAIATLAAGRALHTACDLHIAATWIALLAVLSIPSVHAARIVYRDWSVKRRAARAGAVLPPMVNGEAIGNSDILKRSMEKFRRGYPGEAFWGQVDSTTGRLFEMRLFWTPFYLTTEAAVIKAILATDFPSFEKGQEFREIMDTVLGKGVFNSDGDMWKFHRTMTRPYFSRDRISHFEMFDRHADLAIRMMKERFNGGHAVDFQDLISRFTLDSATEFLFGNCVHSLKATLPYAYNDPDRLQSVYGSSEADRFSEAFKQAQNVLALRARRMPWYLSDLAKDTTEEHMRTVDAYLQPILDEAIRRNRAAIGEKKEEDETMLDHLVKLTDDPVVLHDEVLNIMIAGRDTTAGTLTFAVYLLCLYPEVLKRLRTEIMEKVGPAQVPTIEQIKSMKYLRAVINETLRLYPSVPFNIRVTNQDTTVPNPDPTQPRVFVPKGLGVSYSVFVMHRRKDYWGPDALYFDPDRFIDERLNKYLNPNPFIFLPFNAGPRICLGQQFAYNEMSFFLIRLLQNFSHMELDLSAQPPEARPPAEWATEEGQKGREKIMPKFHLTLYVEGGLWVKMTETEREA